MGQQKQLRNLTVSYMTVDDLKPRANNPRRHSKAQIRQIAKSLDKFGWTNPILIDANGEIIAGHGRFEAARMNGQQVVPTICIDDLSEAERRAYVIADNRLAERSGWDQEMLTTELGWLAEQDLSFDLEITGFETGEIDLMLTGQGASDEDPVELPAEDVAPVSRLGDLWTVGPHRLLCGDARDPSNWAALMDGKTARMVFSDPPFNVPIKGHVSGKGARQHDNFAMAAGEMSASEFTGFLEAVLTQLVSISTDGALHYICMDWRHMGELRDASDGLYSDVKNVCVWSKTNAGMGSLYRSQHELVFVFKVGKAAHVNNVKLGSAGRHRSNVWTYAGANTFRAGRKADLEDHPTVKPVLMVADAIRDASRRGDVLADAFAGAGTTLVAAARTDRVGVGMEIDPRYVDVALRRLAAETGLTPVHSTGATFDEIATLRSREAE